MRWTKAPRIVETKLKSGKINFQVLRFSESDVHPPNARRLENWSKNPEKQHLVDDELRYVKYLEHQLKEIT